MAIHVTARLGTPQRFQLKRVLGRDYALAYWMIAPSVVVLFGLIAFPFIRPDNHGSIWITRNNINYSLQA